MLPPDADAAARWPLPELPAGGPEAAREIAATCERLATLLRSTAVTVDATRQLCTTTTGRSGEEIARAFGSLHGDHEITAQHLEASARTMRRYADEIEAARHRHHFSLSGMLKAGAIFVVVAGAVWVTAPAAAVVVVEGELAVAEAATAAATAASESVAAECSLLARAFAAIRGLANVSRMQIVYGEVWMGAQSMRSEALDSRLLPSRSPRALAMDAVGMAAGAGAGKFAALALAGRTGMTVTLASTGASALGGAVPQTAYDWKRTGSFPARGFAWDAAKGAGSSVISGNGKKLLTKFDKWKAIHHPRPRPGRHRAGRHRPTAG